MQQPTQQEFTQSFYDSIDIMEISSGQQAMGVITFLLHFDERFKNQPFSLVINDVYGSVMHNQYIIATRKIAHPLNKGEFVDQPLAILCWGMFNEPTMVLRSNNVRPLAPLEYRSGDNGYFTIFSSPYEQPEKMMKVMIEKSKKLQNISSFTFVDKLFKPDYNFRVK